MTERPSYGTWPSPISAADVARAGLRLGFPRVVGDDMWWQETRPAEEGRTTIVHRGPDGTARDVLPAPWNARTRVHEYGGRSYLPLPGDEGHAIVFADYADQRLYHLDADGGGPRPLTPEPQAKAGVRYADLVLAPSRDEVWCIRERHTREGVRRDIAAVPLDGGAASDPGAIRSLVSGSDFLAFPCPSPDGRHIAWIAWDHPQMPWDGTELRVAAVRGDGRLGPSTALMGGRTESVLSPVWADDESLYAVSDWSGWWNLYRVPVLGGPPQPEYPSEEEFAGALWALGGSSFALLGDGRVAVLHGVGDHRLGVLDPDEAELHDLDLPYTEWAKGVDTDGTTIVGVAGASDRPLAVVRVDVASGRVEEIRRELDGLPDAAYLPEPRPETLPGPSDREVHANIYPPANPEVTPPDDERPPYVVFVHGGPTSYSPALLDLEKAYFTSRGIGVIDVNYGGSTGYGRAYRERLRRQWGIVDVEDAVAAVQALVERGEADGDRLAVRGGSAGGWTALAAVTRTDVFQAGTSYYGVSELLRFVEDTHDFESRYIDGLVGELPDDRDVYVSRAPLSHVDEISCPVLLIQGLEDPIVPPSQSEEVAKALARKGIPYAFLTFEGEAHGFRKAESLIASLEAELSFYGQVFGFKPPGVPRLELIRPESSEPPHGA
ncbi:MAG: prolyl oligopeptidase family serine peptidase [Streptosporangiaceae bacterium]